MSIRLKPESYRGAMPYLFVSYSHKDSDTVFPLIEQLQNFGIRVWYDEGIEIGSEFPKYIEDALLNSAAFLQFISPNAVESFFCRNEIGLSIDVKPHVTFVVHLCKTELKYGLRLQLRNVQSLLYYEFPTSEVFFKKLVASLWNAVPDIFSVPYGEDGPAEEPQGSPVTYRVLNEEELQISAQGELDRVDSDQLVRPAVVFDETITALASGTCQLLPRLESVRFLSDTTTLGKKAFAGCQNLRRAVLPRKLEILEPGLFGRCSGLAEVVLPATVDKISYRAFYQCKSLTHIEFPAGLKVIETEAFCGCEAISRVEIPETVETMGDKLFLHCHSLESAVIRARISTLQERTFGQCHNLVSVSLSSSLKKIERGAFETCSRLQQIHLPDSVAFIGERAFSGCSQLKSINLPKELKEIGPWAFFGCSGLQECVVPDGVKKIKEGTFSNCSALQTVSLPQNCLVEGTPFPRQCKVIRRGGDKPKSWKFWK